MTFILIYCCNKLNCVMYNYIPISGQMLLLCDDSVVLPIRIIFGNILSTATYLNVWKLANVTPIFKRID